MIIKNLPQLLSLFRLLSASQCVLTLVTQLSLSKQEPVIHEGAAITVIVEEPMLMGQVAHLIAVFAHTPQQWCHISPLLHNKFKVDSAEQYEQVVGWAMQLL